MKKQYIAPALTVVELETQQILCGSAGGGETFQPDDNPYDTEFQSVGYSSDNWWK